MTLWDSLYCLANKRAQTIWKLTTSSTIPKNFLFFLFLLQAYTAELEIELNQLREENARLKLILVNQDGP